MTASVDILILGAGWTAEFLIPLLQQQAQKDLTFEATTRDGREVAGYKTISFAVNDKEENDWSVVPKADTVILTFPTTVEGAVTRYVREYEREHGSGTKWLQLGSTGAWNEAVEKAQAVNPAATFWVDRHTPIPRPAQARVESEFELLALSSDSSPTSVLNLAGLWGGKRSPRNWVVRVAPTKEALKAKGGVHVVHGLDVARAILAIVRDFTPGERWLLTDMRVYDWWDLASAWGSGGEEGYEKPVEGDQPRWVIECMHETGVQALPRPPSSIPGKHLSSSDFWRRFGLTPWRARLEKQSNL